MKMNNNNNNNIILNGTDNLNGMNNNNNNNSNIIINGTDNLKGMNNSNRFQAMLKYASYRIEFTSIGERRASVLQIQDLIFKASEQVPRNFFINIYVKAKLSSNYFITVVHTISIEVSKFITKDIASHIMAIYAMKNDQYELDNCIREDIYYMICPAAKGQILDSAKFKAEQFRKMGNPDQRKPFSTLNVPTSTNPQDWGVIEYIDPKLTIVNMEEKFNENLKAEFHPDNKIILHSESGTIAVIQDEKEGENIIRKYNRDTIIIENNNIKTMYREDTPINYLKPIKRDYNGKFENIVIIDLETYVDNNELQVYAFGIYNGSDIRIGYLTDYESSTQQIREYLKILTSITKDKGIIYAHNLSGFDLIFFQREQVELYGIDNITILYNNQRILEQKQKLDDKTIIFRDSYLLLPNSLANLCKSFDTVMVKGNLDHKLINKDNQIEYRVEVTKYQEQDLLSLYEIQNKYHDNIRDKHRMSIMKYPTLPSLAMAIYRKSYFPDNVQIPVFSDDIEMNIRSAYLGGHSDVYKTYGKDQYYYDVNSEYPAAMQNDMPVGNPVHVRGEIIQEEFFGYQKVKVQAPANIKYPTLLTRMEGSTIAAQGILEGWYFSEEQKDAVNRGYEIIEIEEGYQFERAKIFDSYIKEYYDIKANGKGADRAIAKLFLNSLYGKFGTNNITTNHKLIDCRLEDETDYITIAEIDQNIRQVEYIMEDKEKYTFRNVAIAAAITAHSRMIQNRYKDQCTGDVYYQDTDSIVTDQPIDQQFIGKEIGLQKLEHIIKEGVFINSKVYGLRQEDKDIVKVKGFKNRLTFDQLKSQQRTDSIIVEYHNLLVNDYSRATKLIQKRKYTIQINENKRKQIINNDMYISTTPYIIANKVKY